MEASVKFLSPALTSESIPPAIVKDPPSGYLVASHVVVLRGDRIALAPQKTTTCGASYLFIAITNLPE